MQRLTHAEKRARENNGAHYLTTTTPEQTAAFIAECKASIRRLNGEVLAAIDARNFTSADRLDRQRTALHRQIAKATA